MILALKKKRKQYIFIIDFKIKKDNQIISIKNTNRPNVVKIFLIKVQQT